MSPFTGAFLIEGECYLHNYEACAKPEDEKKAMTLSTKLVASTAAVFLTVTSCALACSEYERQVHEVATAVQGFRQSSNFTETYGWAIAGPYGQWLQKIRQLSDDTPNARALVIDYGFAPMDIYLVADEFRTAGGLDSYFTEIDAAIGGLSC